jgi:hypothetical protein
VLVKQWIFDTLVLGVTALAVIGSLHQVKLPKTHPKNLKSSLVETLNHSW